MRIKLRIVSTCRSEQRLKRLPYKVILILMHGFNVFLDR